MMMSKMDSRFHGNDMKQRAVVRESGTLNFLFSDHLGSTSLTVEDDETTVYAETRYTLWRSVRYANGTAMMGERKRIVHLGRF